MAAAVPPPVPGAPVTPPPVPAAAAAAPKPPKPLTLPLADHLPTRLKGVSLKTLSHLVQTGSSKKKDGVRPGLLGAPRNALKTVKGAQSQLRRIAAAVRKAARPLAQNSRATRKILLVQQSAMRLVEHYEAQDLRRLDNAWLACRVPLSTRCTAAELDALEFDEAEHEMWSKLLEGFVAYQTAKNKGFSPLGVISEQMENGEYRARASLPDPAAPIVHVTANKAGLPAMRNTDPVTALTPPADARVFRVEQNPAQKRAAGYLEQVQALEKTLVTHPLLAPFYDASKDLKDQAALTLDRMQPLFEEGGAWSTERLRVQLCKDVIRFNTALMKQFKKARAVIKIKVTQTLEPALTYAALREHFESLPPEQLKLLHGAWLACGIPIGDWQLAADVTPAAALDTATANPKSLAGLAAMHVALDRGIKPLGIVSDFMQGGTYRITQDGAWVVAANQTKKGHTIVHVDTKRRGFPDTKNTELPTILTPPAGTYKYTATLKRPAERLQSAKTVLGDVLTALWPGWDTPAPPKRKPAAETAASSEAASTSPETTA